LYIPDRLPMPNTPQFQDALIQQILAILFRIGNWGLGTRDWGLGKILPNSSPIPGLVVILVGDTPLKAQVGAVLASEFGSRVQVEKTSLNENGILVTGWEFWRQYQSILPVPKLLAIATLPIPSLEDPLVAGRVAYYKKRRQDWFRLYLLPAALRELQRAIAPLRECQGIVALLDGRIHHRSYGQEVLASLSPSARINYLDPSWF
jgi:ATP-dependent DNA helicase DinG